MAEKAAISILLNEFEKEQKIPLKKRWKRQGGGLSSAWAMVWLNVSRECELFTLTVTSYTEKEILLYLLYDLWIKKFSIKSEIE